MGPIEIFNYWENTFSLVKVKMQVSTCQVTVTESTAEGELTYFKVTLAQIMVTNTSAERI